MLFAKHQVSSHLWHDSFIITTFILFWSVKRGGQEGSRYKHSKHINWQISSLQLRTLFLTSMSLYLEILCMQNNSITWCFPKMTICLLTYAIITSPTLKQNQINEHNINKVTQGSNPAMNSLEIYRIDDLCTKNLSIFTHLTNVLKEKSMHEKKYIWKSYKGKQFYGLRT